MSAVSALLGPLGLKLAGLNYGPIIGGGGGGGVGGAPTGDAAAVREGWSRVLRRRRTPRSSRSGEVRRVGDLVAERETNARRSAEGRKEGGRRDERLGDAPPSLSHPPPFADWTPPPLLLSILSQNFSPLHISSWFPPMRTTFFFHFSP